MEYKFKKHYKGRGVFIMERTISIEERIRRAEEIYNRRQNRDIRVSSSTVNSGQKTTLPLFKKMILQLLICTVIYFIFYLIKNNNVINSKLEVVSYNLIIDLIKVRFGIGYATKEFISDELNNKSLYEIKIDNNISKRTIVIATINKKEPNYSSKKLIEMITNKS